MLSIIIPFYKLAYFEDTLNSLANQTNKDFKVYVGDDASPDDCLSLLNKFAGKFDYEYFKFETNLGSSSLTQQWERCIALSNGEDWIMILGDDDFLSPTVVQSFYDNYANFSGKSNVIRYATRKVFDRCIEGNNLISHPIWESATDAFYRKLVYQTRSSLSEYIFSKKSYLKYKFHNYPLAWNSDDRAWLDFSDGKPIYSINESFVYFRMSSVNISGKIDNKVAKNKSEIEFYKYLVENELNQYRNDQRLRILRRYQSEIRVYRKLTVNEFFVLFYFYFKYLNLKWIKKFFRKVFYKLTATN